MSRVTSVPLGLDNDIDTLLLRAGRHPLAARVAHALRTQCNVASTDALLVGLSGGADSTALLLLLLGLSRHDSPPCAAPRVLHVDHGLRCASGAEANAAMALCSRLGVSARVTSLSLTSTSSNLAARARDARYDALENEAKETGCACVCVAHHADDRFETLLQNVSRGCGPASLASPRWRRALGETALVRPLLSTRHDELISFCTALGVDWNEDPSNHDASSARGHLRASVMPALEARWPGAATRAAHTADAIAVAAQALDEKLERLFGSATLRDFDRSIFTTVEPALLEAQLHRLFGTIEDLSHERVSARTVHAVVSAIQDANEHPRTFSLIGSWRLEVTARAVELTRTS